MARTPIHPGEILADELEELGLTSAELARTIDVPANRISQIIAGKRNVTADTALRLGRYFGTSADFWMNLQKTYELDLARRDRGAASQASNSRSRSSRQPRLPGVSGTLRTAPLRISGTAGRLGQAGAVVTTTSPDQPAPASPA
jgi:antitoxin HigA-1